MPLVPCSRRQSETGWHDDIQEPPARRLRLSPPELTDVLFEVHSDLGSRSCQRRGALSAFLDQQNKPKPGHRARHYSFSFDSFRLWAARWVGDLDVSQWVLCLDDSHFTFDEESSWQSALIGVNHLLEQADLRSYPRNPVVIIAPLPNRFFKNSPLIAGSSVSAHHRRQLTLQQGAEGGPSTGNATSSGEESDEAASSSTPSAGGLFSDEGSGFEGNESTDAESSDSQNDSAVDTGSEEDEEDVRPNQSEEQDSNGDSLTSTIDQTQESNEQVEVDKTRVGLSKSTDEGYEHEENPKEDLSSDSLTSPTEDHDAEGASPTQPEAMVQKQAQASTTIETLPNEEEPHAVLEMDADISSDEEESSCDEDMEDDMEEESFGNQGIAPAQQLLFKQPFLTKKKWAEICTVLDHPIEQRDGGKLLLGTHQSLRIHQMAFIVRAMKAHRVAEELNGLLLADNVGIGKSICALGLFAVTSLALLNLRHREKYPEKHLPKKEKRSGLKCPSGNIYGIQCVCVPDGVAHDYVQHLVYGPSVFSVPASNLDAWARRVSLFFKRTFRAKGSTIDEELVEPLYYRETGQLSPIPLDGKEKSVRKEDLVATPKVSTSRKRILSTAHGEARRSDSKPLTYQQAFATYGSTGSLYFKSPPIGKTQFRFLILLSFTALGRQTTAMARVLGVQTAIPHPHQAKDAGKGKSQAGARIRIIIPFAISVNLFFFDESHSVTSKDTQLFNSFDDIRRLSGTNRRKQTRWYFMTATPFSHSPNDIHSCLRFLVGNQVERKRLLEELPKFASRFRRLQPKASASAKKRPVGSNNDDTTAKFAQDFAKFVRPFTVARDWGSPYLDTCLHDIRPGIKHHVVRVSVPPELEKAVESLGARCRRRLTVLRAEKRRDLHLAEVTGMKIFTQFFSAGIAPGLAAILDCRDGHLLPTSVRRVDEDFRLGERGVLRKTLNWHQGHEWTEKLAEIIKLAHGGGKDQSLVTGNSSPESEGPCHILLVAQTPVLVGLIVRFIEEDPELKNITRAKRIFQSVTPKPAGRDTLLRSIEKEAAQSDRTYVLVTTPRLIGVGVDIVFCSYVVQFGEIFSNREREQLIGRVNRPGQQLTVHHWHIMSTQRAHALVRERNNGRSVMLSEHGLVDVEGDGAEVVSGEGPEETQQVEMIDEN